MKTTTKNRQLIGYAFKYDADNWEFIEGDYGTVTNKRSDRFFVMTRSAAYRFLADMLAELDDGVQLPKIVAVYRTAKKKTSLEVGDEIETYGGFYGTVLFSDPKSVVIDWRDGSRDMYEPAAVRSLIKEGEWTVL